MSYLDVPRLHFAGTFIAKPSTVNNTASNFEPTVTNPFPSWNPNGNHFWQFLNCTVKSAFDENGAVSGDPIINAKVESTDSPVPAKLVDLDTEQQMVSQIFGLQLQVAISDGEYFQGDFRPVNFNDIFVRTTTNPKPDSMFSAYFQSVLDNVVWSYVQSPLLLKLQSISPNTLSIKFVVDGYNDDSTSPQFNQGRIVGTIGPAFPGEPPNFVIGRALRPAGGNSPLSFGYAKVDKNRQVVTVDLGKSIPTTTPMGPPPNLGALQVAIVPPSGSPNILGEYDYSQAAYETNAGVQEFPASPYQISLLASTPLGVLQPNPGNPAAVSLGEGANCTYINATQIVYRLNPGEVADVELFATQYGEPAGGQEITLELNGNLLQPAPISAAPPLSPPPPQPPVPTAMAPVATPASALSFPPSVTTGPDGRATFKLYAYDPGNPRDFIDTFQGPPTWASVAPFLLQYAKLYPFMDSLFKPGGLADPKTYQQNIQAFEAVLTYPMTDPRYMPVTRDMSRDKRNVLLAWLAAGAPIT